MLKHGGKEVLRFNIAGFCRTTYPNCTCAWIRRSSSGAEHKRPTVLKLRWRVALFGGGSLVQSEMLAGKMFVAGDTIGFETDSCTEEFQRLLAIPQPKVTPGEGVLQFGSIHVGFSKRFEKLKDKRRITVERTRAP